MRMKFFLATACVLCATPLLADSHVSDLVLWGTDVRKLDTLDFVPVADDPSGSYRMELGGAEVFLEIAAAGDEWAVTRTYKAPGITDEIVSYVASYNDGMMTDQSGQLHIRAIADALLVYENTGTDVPSAGLWLIYDPH